ncbi:hypothetical protein QBC44DRAFT_370697 [Cladorrhinum sp. PSN332]|nr:hypothetical protein QBC44DRAFT_370697 [Cladorrhinum sp. PSN332]
MTDSGALEPSDWSGISFDDEIEAIANPDGGFGIPRDVDNLSGAYDGAPDVAVLFPRADEALGEGRILWPFRINVPIAASLPQGTDEIGQEPIDDEWYDRPSLVTQCARYRVREQKGEAKLDLPRVIAGEFLRIYPSPTGSGLFEEGGLITGRGGVTPSSHPAVRLRTRHACSDFILDAECRILTWGHGAREMLQSLILECLQVFC